MIKRVSVSNIVHFSALGKSLNEKHNIMQIIVTDNSLK